LHRRLKQTLGMHESGRATTSAAVTRHLVAQHRKSPLKVRPLTLVPYSFSIGYHRHPRNQSGLSLPSGAGLRRGRDGRAGLARRHGFRLGYVCGPAGKYGQVLLSYPRRRLSIQAAVRTCGGRASCRQRALTAGGPIKSSCRRGSVNAATATRRFTSSAGICRYAVGGTPSFTTASGFTFTVSPTQRMPINSCNGSAGKNSTRLKGVKVRIGRNGRNSQKVPAASIASCFCLSVMMG